MLSPWRRCHRAPPRLRPVPLPSASPHPSPCIAFLLLLGSAVVPLSFVLVLASFLCLGFLCCPKAKALPGRVFPQAPDLLTVSCAYCNKYHTFCGFKTAQIYYRPVRFASLWSRCLQAGFSGGEPIFFPFPALVGAHVP